ncbi:tRNA uridine-5-carboxymethylaminomethyl(34) synthesis GTPase MnmE [bacterium]|nr:tRNA uridine-5-carboxymethylaminomethyl(34) synthesis GTPase MnmE [bacterium]
MFPFNDDTIAAISTPPGTGGLAVVRLSGPEALDTISKLFSAPEKLTPRYASYGKLIHPDLGEGEFDDCVVTFFKGPNSATGEDLVEISVHGGSYVQQKLLEVLLLAPGVRIASAGEFTFRAFLRGRIDLSRAEAVVDLIHARDAAAHKNARQQLQGGLLNLVGLMSDDLIKILTILEAELDFSDQEIAFTPTETHLETIRDLKTTTSALLETYFYGSRLEEGFRFPLVGAPNSGKSSLFNMLLGQDRAIVTAQPGTTRDTIEKTIIIAGHSVVLVDTAGLREAQGEAELSGIDRSKEEIEKADLVILVHSLDTEDLIPVISENTPHVIVYNKIDLGPRRPKNKDIYLSCKTGEGLTELKELLYSHVINSINAGVAGVILNNERHRNVFDRFGVQLSACLLAVEDGYGPEYVASDIRQALDILGEITGKTTPEDILNNIFSGFCVGK